ncbi:MAG: NAD(P) transhydrogenase subunit alpha [Clostridia bacterium]|jgi:NAD(P) transhydrogenase subunit alpha|nr:NAD(P) transhydrogenase subunit alpha [Clostridiaceae bacterium]
MQALLLILVFLVSTVVGYMIIKNVPSLLHTPLMSGMNALSGITVLGALTTAAIAIQTGSKILGYLAIVLAMINVAGGFTVTGRMLKMFKNKGDDNR